MNTAMDIFLLSAVVIIIVQVRFLSVPMHVDCSNLRYPGLMLAKGEIDHREFAIMSGHLGNKIAIFYFNLFAYRLFPRLPNAGPRLFYLIYTGLTSLVIYDLFLKLISEDIACVAVFLYAIINFYPRFYSYYDSIEKYAHLPIFLLLGWTLDSTPTSAFLAGAMAPILFFLFKPTYVFECLIAGLWLSWSGFLLTFAMGAACGMVVICLIALSRRGDLRELVGYFKQLHLNGNLIYFFKFRNVGARYGRAPAGKAVPASVSQSRKPGKVKTSRPAFFFLLPALPAILMIALSCAGGLTGLFAVGGSLFPAMLFAAAAGLLLQFRFFGYHLLPLVPYGVFGGAYMWVNSTSGSWQHRILLIFMGLLLFEMIRFLFSSDEDINRILFKKIPHYMHRNIACAHLAARLRGEKIRSLLQWDEGCHINVLLGIPSPAGNNEVAPWSYSLYPAKAKALIVGCRRQPPEVLIPMIDNINWENLTALTGLHFKKEESSTIIIENEAFSLYRLDRDSASQFSVENIQDAELSSKLFFACRCVTEDQHHIWNSIHHDCHAQ